MSKKKTKTRIEKVQKVHHLEHVAKAGVIVVRGSSEIITDKEAKKNELKSPLNLFIKRDLRSSTTLIIVFIILIAIAGLVVYKTGLVNPILSHWNIKY